MMSKYPTNMFGQPLRPGDIVVLTTTSGKRSRTRIAKVDRVVEIDFTRYNHQLKMNTLEKRYRVFMRLVSRARKMDDTGTKWALDDTGTKWAYTLRTYVKEVFGYDEAVPMDFYTLPTEYQEALSIARRV